MTNFIKEAVTKIKEHTRERGAVDLGKGPVLSSLVRLAVPSIAMVLFHTLFNLVDTVFISWLGESYMVAISYTFPVQIGVWAVYEGVGNGVTALVGRKLGEGNQKEAQRIAESGLIFSYLLCLLWLPFIFEPASNAFFRMLGATDPVTLHQAYLYNLWIPPTLLTISYTYMGNSLFRCQGNTIIPLKYFIIANGLNLVLDPIFIFTFGWGMTGAAFATFIGRVAGLFYIMKKLRDSSALKLPVIAPPRLWMARYWMGITKIGLPVTLATGSVACGMGTVNKILSSTYGNAAVAGWMIELRVEDISFNSMMGINDALVPFLAYNYGSRNLSRMKAGIIAAVKISACITIPLGLALMIWPWPAVALFRPTAHTADIAVQSLRITIAAYPLVIYNIFYNALFVATGYSAFGLIVQICRSLIFRISAIWLLAGLVSIQWIWLFQPISFVGGTLVTWLFAHYLMKKLERDMGGVMLKTK